MDLREKLIHGNNAIYLGVLAWFIASMWFDEPGTTSDAEAEPEPGEADAAALEGHEAADESESHPENAGTDFHN